MAFLHEAFNGSFHFPSITPTASITIYKKSDTYIVQQSYCFATLVQYSRQTWRFD